MLYMLQWLPNRQTIYRPANTALPDQPRQTDRLTDWKRLKPILLQFQRDYLKWFDEQRETRGQKCNSAITRSGKDGVKDERYSVKSKETGSSARGMTREDWHWRIERRRGWRSEMSENLRRVGAWRRARAEFYERWRMCDDNRTGKASKTDKKKQLEKIRKSNEAREQLWSEEFVTSKRLKW